MKIVSLAVVAFSLASCSTPEERARDALLDGIEQSIQMPQRAKALDAYARYYMDQRDGEIVGIYMLPGLDELPPGEGCEQITLDGPSTQCSFTWPKSTIVGAGNRVWLPSQSDLPMPMRDASDCGVVSMVYRVADRHFVEVACFGQDAQY